MTIIVFLIDTSASMNARCYLGGRPTLLDVAKGAVETFVKVRQRSQESRGDRYMLLSFEDPPLNIKAGWKENLATFMNELKNLRSDGLTTMGPALKNAFDLLNINRMQSGIDTYGQGRCPFFLEPSVIVVITDGGKLTSLAGIQEDFNLPMHSPIPGSELTREPFRWDQRLFSLVLRLPGTPAIEQNIGLVPSDTSPIDAMCEVTGGRSYCVTSHRIMIQCIDSLVQKVQSGVVINFEKIGPDPLPPEVKSEPDTPSEEYNEWLGSQSSPNCSQDSNGSKLSSQNISQCNQATASLAASPSAWHNCRRLIYVARSAQKGFAVGYWPIPENFWPDQNSTALPPRSAHPNVKFTCTSQEPLVIENLPFDKYELEPSPLTQYILARKAPTVCWQVFVANSYKNSEVGHPFGYLKASTNLTCVNLFVMPYNYPVLLPLLDELFKIHRLKPINEWRTQFQNYLRTMPPYYAGPLKRALIRMGTPGTLAQTLIPDALESSLSYSVLNYLKRLKNQAKSEFDRMCNEVGTKTIVKNGIILDSVRVLPRSPLRKELVSHPLLQDKFISLREQLNEFGGYVVGIPQESDVQQVFIDPGDIPRNQLVDQYNLLRDRFFNMNSQLQFDDEIEHNLPVNQMGNYQEYLKRMPNPLREIESTPVRQHMFGNPFKIDKRMMVDEADIDLVGGSSPSRGSKRVVPSEPSPRQNNKRKPGPLPKDTVARRPSATGMLSVPSIGLPKSSRRGTSKNNAKSSGLAKRNSGESHHPEYSPTRSTDSSAPKLTAAVDHEGNESFPNDDGGTLKMPMIDVDVDDYDYDSYEMREEDETSAKVESLLNEVEMSVDKTEMEDPVGNVFFKPTSNRSNGFMAKGNSTNDFIPNGASGNGPILDGLPVNGPINGVILRGTEGVLNLKMGVYDPKMDVYNPAQEFHLPNVEEQKNKSENVEDVEEIDPDEETQSLEIPNLQMEAYNPKIEVYNPRMEMPVLKVEAYNPKTAVSSPKIQLLDTRVDIPVQLSELQTVNLDAQTPTTEVQISRIEALNTKTELSNSQSIRVVQNLKPDGQDSKPECQNIRAEVHIARKSMLNTKVEGTHSNSTNMVEVDRSHVDCNGNGIGSDPDAEESEVEVNNFNLNIRSIASVEVRKPGRRHGPLLEHLRTLKGNIDTRLLVVEDIVKEALRFKRLYLAHLLQDFASTDEFLGSLEDVIEPLPKRSRRI